MTFASSISNSSRIVLYFYSIVARARPQCQGAQPFPGMAQEGEITKIVAPTPPQKPEPKNRLKALKDIDLGLTLAGASSIIGGTYSDAPP
jgi:hypothetical protein